MNQNIHYYFQVGNFRIKCNSIKANKKHCITYGFEIMQHEEERGEEFPALMGTYSPHHQILYKKNFLPKFFKLSNITLKYIIEKNPLFLLAE